MLVGLPFVFYPKSAIAALCFLGDICAVIKGIHKISGLENAAYKIISYFFAFNVLFICVCPKEDNGLG